MASITRMRFIGADAFRQKADALTDAVNMGIHRKSGRLKAKHKTIAAVLGPTPFMLVSHALASSMGKSARKSMLISPRSLRDMPQHFLNTRAFLVRQSRRLDGLNHFIGRRIAHGFIGRDNGL